MKTTKYSPKRKKNKMVNAKVKVILSYKDSRKYFISNGYTQWKRFYTNLVPSYTRLQKRLTEYSIDLNYFDRKVSTNVKIPEGIFVKKSLEEIKEYAREHNKGEVIVDDTYTTEDEINYYLLREESKEEFFDSLKRTHYGIRFYLPDNFIGYSKLSTSELNKDKQEGIINLEGKLSISHIYNKESLSKTELQDLRNFLDKNTNTLLILSKDASNTLGGHTTSSRVIHYYLVGDYTAIEFYGLEGLLTYIKSKGKIK